MSVPDTTAGGSTRPAREEEHRGGVREITDATPESTLAATNGPVRQAMASHYAMQAFNAWWAERGRDLARDLCWNVWIEGGCAFGEGLAEVYKTAPANDEQRQLAQEIRQLIQEAEARNRG
jgi:hypothetical protein